MSNIPTVDGKGETMLNPTINCHTIENRSVIGEGLYAANQFI